MNPFPIRFPIFPNMERVGLLLFQRNCEGGEVGVVAGPLRLKWSTFCQPLPRPQYRLECSVVENVRRFDHRRRQQGIKIDIPPTSAEVPSCRFLCHD